MYICFYFFYTIANEITYGAAWAYHMGHFLADQRYGTLGSCQGEQVGGFSYCPGSGRHPHIDVLEAFDPILATDPFSWIPKGLMQDLMDNTPGEFVVNDPGFHSIINPVKNIRIVFINGENGLIKIMLFSKKIIFNGLLKHNTCGRNAHSVLNT